MDIKELKTKIPEDVVELLQEIQYNMPEFNVYLGGGFIRDLYCGLVPKDIDIFLVPLGGLSWDGREYIPVNSMVIYRKNTDDIEIASDMKARGVQKLVGLWCKKLEIKDVQYIIYDKYLTQPELSDDFDFNVCQITYDPMLNWIDASDNFFLGHEEKELECLHTYCEERTLARYERMESKFPEYKVIGKPDVVSLKTESGASATPSVIKMTRCHAGSV